VEGPLAEDDDGRRWELTVRVLKRRWQLLFSSGVVVAPVARVDMRQGGWGGGGLGLAQEGERMGEGEKKEVAMGGARFKWCTEVVNGSVGWHHASRVEEGIRRSARRGRLAGKGPEAGGCERRWPRRAARARAHSDRGERGLTGGPLLQSQVAQATTMWAPHTVPGFEFFKPVNFI
jgi:hypothetical protein